MGGIGLKQSTKERNGKEGQRKERRKFQMGRKTTGSREEHVGRQKAAFLAWSREMEL